MERKNKRNSLIRKKIFSKLIYNLVSIFILLYLFNFIIFGNNSYNYIWNKLLIANLVFVKKNNNLSIVERYQLKFGFFSEFTNYININTPEDAIILMPSDSIIDLLDEKYNLHFLKNRIFTTYFIYPRKAIYEKKVEQDQSYLDKITHVSIVNYCGYEKLNYNIQDKQKFTVAPVNLINQK